jgi:endonuclease/exonuclease/phosphatase family metal-dependent hydrolase
MDRRLMPERVLRVLREVHADVFALQEVLSVENGHPGADQARYLASELGYNLAVGHVRELRGGFYGNVVLSRLPVLFSCNYDISVRRREERGCLRSDLDLGGGDVLHVFNVHMGTAYMERRAQVRKLMNDQVLQHTDLGGHRIVLGDFNEWTRGLASKLLSDHFERVDMTLLNWRRTYPGFLPFLHLDHMYHDSTLKLDRLALHRTRTSLIASDHLPLVGDFFVLRPQGAGTPGIQSAPSGPQG